GFLQALQDNGRRHKKQPNNGFLPLILGLCLPYPRALVTRPTAMFILGDESKSNGKLPWVTFSLIAINIVTYSAQCFVGPPLTRGFSLVPKEITTLKDLTATEHLRA